MIKIKQIVFIIPFLVICIIVIQLYSEKKIVSYDKSLPQKIKTTLPNAGRVIASEDITKDLAFSLRKINDQQKNEKIENDDNNEYSLDDYQKADADLNYLKGHYFSKDKDADQESSHQRTQRIQLRISGNQELYNEILHLKLEDSLLDNDNLSTTQLFALAASMPIGTSSIHYSAEKILLDLAAMDRSWDEDLFRNALQFYYIQNLIKNEKNDALVEYFSEKCPNEQLRKKILEIDKEINIYAVNKEDER